MEIVQKTDTRAKNTTAGPSSESKGRIQKKEKSTPGRDGFERRKRSAFRPFQPNGIVWAHAAPKCPIVAITIFDALSACNQVEDWARQGRTGTTKAMKRFQATSDLGKVLLGRVLVQPGAPELGSGHFRRVRSFLDQAPSDLLDKATALEGLAEFARSDEPPSEEALAQIMEATNLAFTPREQAALRSALVAASRNTTWVFSSGERARWMLARLGANLEA
jgi:hypothetical protein